MVRKKMENDSKTKSEGVITPIGESQQGENGLISSGLGRVNMSGSNNHTLQSVGGKSETSSNTSMNGSIKKSSTGTGLTNSREDIISLGGGSSLNSQSIGTNNGGLGGPNRKQKELYPPQSYNGMPTRPENAQRSQHNEEQEDGLGPLPPKWEKAYTENGELYFIDHNTGTSHWLDPRLSKFQKKSLEECSDDELPYGWEKIQDPQYGTYFIDHVNRRTQYENPVLEAKRRAERNRNDTLKQNLPYTFTKNPAEMYGERITTTLLKSSRGLGITIVGGDDNIEEFLQIKSIVPNGPAWLDGKLQMGDILVYVNDTCVLGFTHHEMVNVFQSILPGETVTLEVCRGYPLPFDPNDPNTEVVTTIAVDGINSDPEKSRIMMDLNMDGNYNFLDLSDTSGAVGGGSGGTLGQKNPLSKIQSPNAATGGPDQSEAYNRDDILLYKKPEILNISIVKGIMGFGFTIADSAYGQKVKKILDRNCCKDLQEGDILLEINNTSVKHLSHSEVVQVLKDCPKTQETTLKVQRGHYFSGGINGSGRAANKIRRSGGGTATTTSKESTGSGLYRSKTPTADLYSTQTKEVLPIRPKTPLVDTRRARAKTPSNDLNEEVEAVTNSLIKNDDNKSIAADTKSNNSLNELDSINNEIPYMDPLPKLVTSLTERLAEASMLQDNHNNIYNHPVDPIPPNPNRPNYENQLAADYNYQNTYGNGNGGGSGSYHSTNLYSPPPPMALMAPIPTYHQDTCYCYECQDYNRYRMDYQMQSSAAASHPNHSIYPQYSSMPMQNGRGQKRVNEYMFDRRKSEFGVHENHQPPPVLSNQGFPQTYWKYGSNAVVGLVQPVTEDEYTLSEVTLERQALGFGFRIVGGTEEGSQVTVGHIVPGGSADGDSRIATGDEILSIDGVNVINASHHKVVSLMGEAALRGQVKMILRRRVRHTAPSRSVRYPYDVIVTRNENEGFGFVIISSSNQYYGSTIGKLIPGSPADRCVELNVGDRIVAVNRIEITGMSHGDVVNLIKDSGLHVRLTIGSPKDIPPIVQHQQQSQSASIPVALSATKSMPTNESPYFDRSQLIQHPQL